MLFLIFAAFTYLTAAGDPTKVASAKDRLIYAAVAMIIAFLAVGFGLIIRNFLISRQLKITCSALPAEHASKDNHLLPFEACLKKNNMFSNYQLCE